MRQLKNPMHAREQYPVNTEHSNNKVHWINEAIAPERAQKDTNWLIKNSNAHNDMK